MSDVPDSLLPGDPKAHELEEAFAGTDPKHPAKPNDVHSADGTSNTTGPTDSHVLSQTIPDDEAKGLAHTAGESGLVSDIGWDQTDVIAERIVPGISNEDLFLLVRRFDKVFHLIP